MDILGMEQSDQFCNLESLLTADEVARILNISRSYAYLLMRRGDIPTVHIGRSARVRPSDLELFVSQNVTRGMDRHPLVA